jgi:hypothetical protein
MFSFSFPLRLDRGESDATLAHRMGEGLGVRALGEVAIPSLNPYPSTINKSPSTKPCPRPRNPLSSQGTEKAMNRIHQGRVTAVEIPDGKDEQGKPLDIDVLWRHHELFQDAVNYYLLALLSLARDPANPVTPIRKRMDDKASEHQIWTSFRRRGQMRRGMRDSVAKYLCPGKTEPTLEECFAAVLDGNKESPNVLDLALQELLDECDGDGASCGRRG